jgi:hypothetical protein
LHDIVDPRGLVPALAEQLDRGVDDLPPQAGFLPFPKSDFGLLPHSLSGHIPYDKHA